MTPTESQAAASIPGEATLPFDRAFADLAQALQNALATTTQHDAVMTRYSDYVALLQAAMAGQDVRLQCEQAYAIYIAALQEALAAAPQRQHAFDAFDRYISAIRDAWTSVDVRMLTAEAIAAIAQQMLAAASTVASLPRDSSRTGSDASPPPHHTAPY